MENCKGTWLLDEWPHSKTKYKAFQFAILTSIFPKYLSKLCKNFLPEVLSSCFRKTWICKIKFRLVGFLCDDCASTKSISILEAIARRPSILKEQNCPMKICEIVRLNFQFFSNNFESSNLFYFLMLLHDNSNISTQSMPTMVQID